MIDQYQILIARTCSYGTEHAELTNWMFRAAMSLRGDARCGAAYTQFHGEHRIHCARNELVQMAIDNKMDYLCFVDGDMDPDFRLWNDNAPDDKQYACARKWAKPFLPSSLNFMMTERCGIVGAPAVSGPPANKLNVFLPRDTGDTPVSRMSHDEFRNTPPSFSAVYAIGTGLMLIDMDVFKAIKEPWFEDFWDHENKQRTPRLSQDCAFCAKCSDIGIPIYANFYAPAGHIKHQRQEPPEPVVFQEK